MAKKPETRRQQRIQKALKAKYRPHIWLFKVHGGPFQADGIPDIVGVVHGLFFGFEVKEPNGTATALQLETIKDIRAAGGIAAVIIEPEEAIAKIDRALARAARGS